MVRAAEEWSLLRAGIVQRVRALEAFLADVHGAAEIVRDGVLPRRLITGCARFQRAAAGLAPPTGVRIHVAGIDLVRDGDGVLRVVRDDLRNPAGVPAAHLLRALRSAAPCGGAEPTVVVLTPGVFNPAHAEHALLARQLGAALVEGRDLFCRDNVVHHRTTGGERRVDVIHRCIDDEFLDPLQFKPDSVLGVAGVLNAARAGNVVIANAVGNGVADDGLVRTHVPDMIGYYLGERQLLPDVATYRCWLDDERSHVLARLDELVLTPTGGAGGDGALFGPDATARELARARRAIEEDPRGWTARPPARHAGLRAFAVNTGAEVLVLPGPAPEVC